jgi:PDZ domain-containing protein
VKRVFSPGRLLALGLVLLAGVLALAVVPSSEYIFLPDRAHPVAPYVTVSGGHDPTLGGVYYVDVIVRKATLLERLFPSLRDGADLYPAAAVDPPGVDDVQRRRIDLQDMHRSQQIAAAVALRAAGKHVVMRATGALVSVIEPGTPAVGRLEPGDVITAVAGTHVRTPGDVHAAMTHHRAGDVIAFAIRRGKQSLVEKIKTVKAGRGSSRPVVGVFLETALDIQLPLKVRIDVGQVGGPSAGLPFALEVMEEVGKDVVHGHKIAATGEIFPDGSVGPIGGIKQKTIGAREAGVDAFLVPAGQNVRDARKYAGSLPIVPVESFPQALRALATLRPVA